MGWNCLFCYSIGHIPHWLNTECSKLKVIRHDEFIPEKYLPTFSSRPIELNLHRIPGLPEKFVYFNDDMFLNNHVEMNLFFRDDLPCDFIQMNHIVFDSYSDKFNHTLANNEAVINENFTVRDIRKHIRLIANFTYPIEDNFRNMLFLRHKYILNMKSSHLPISYCKSDFERVWAAIPEILDETCKNKFRTLTDVNSWLIRNWRLVEGRFYPINRHKLGHAYFLKTDNDIYSILKALNSSEKMICINDGYMSDEKFIKYKNQISIELQRKFRSHSSFELA